MNAARRLSTSDSAYPRLEVTSRGDLRRWLERHHATERGIWLVTRKRSAGGLLVWNDIVEEALCFGWIDSLPRKVDEFRSMLRLTPRQPKSNWSLKNKAHVASLMKRGLMQPAGLAAVEFAKQRGTWNALDEVSALEEPRDLVSALTGHPGAEQNWRAFPPSVRRGILEWIFNAKRPETRARRIEETARLALRNVRANQWR
jgi:uncharacterized protein YdeI (YjbR/CyaY-like superfamily)